MALETVVQAEAAVAFYTTKGKIRWNEATHRMLGRPASVDIQFDATTRELRIVGNGRGGSAFTVMGYDNDARWGIQASEVYDVTGTPASIARLTPAYVSLPEPPPGDMSGYVGTVTMTLPAFG